MSSRPVRLCVFLVALIGATPGHAQPGSGERLYQQATAEFDAGRYREAIALYLQSLRSVEHQHTLYAIGEAYRRLGELRRSHEYYARYATRLPAAERTAFAAKLERLRTGSPSLLRIDCGLAAAELRVDGAQRGHTDSRGRITLKIAGGAHRVRLEKQGFVAESREVSAQFGEPLELVLTLRRRPEQEPRRAAPPSSLRVSPFVAALGGIGFSSFGDPGLEVSAAADALLRGGVLVRGARLGAFVELQLSAVPISCGR
jgi:tetratricopeptide (TPR) repeat protein